MKYVAATFGGIARLKQLIEVLFLSGGSAQEALLIFRPDIAIYN